MKKFIRVVVLVIVGVVVGGYLIDFLNNMPEEWLLAGQSHLNHVIA